MYHPPEGLRADLAIAATPTYSHTLLANPEALPFRDIGTILRRGSYCQGKRFCAGRRCANATANERQRVLIVAPHPDDETLGCGGSIALLCSKGYDVKVLVISDGTASHPNSQKYPAPVLQSIRSQETLTALAILGVDRSAITFLQLKDGAIPTITSPNFLTAKSRCQKYLEKILPDTIGILTEKLARRCQSLLSVDVSQIAQQQAIDRCLHLNNIKFELMSVPQSFPTASFDLIVLSEVGYYWSWEDLHQAQDLILDRLRSQGHLLLVHWTADTGILPLTGNQVHDNFLSLVPNQLKRIKSLTQEKYRLDLFEKI